MRNALLTCLAIAVIGFAPGDAVADDVAIVTFEGKRADKIQARVARVLEQRGFTTREVESADDAGEAKAIVTGKVSRRGGRWQVQLTVLNGADGKRLGRTRVRARKLRSLPRLTQRYLWRRLGKAVRKGKVPAPPPEAEPEPAPAPAEPAPAEPAPPAPAPSEGESTASPLGTTAKVKTGGGGGGIEAELALGGRFYSRRLSYNQDLFSALSEHRADGTPALALDGQVYLLPWAGVAGSFAHTTEFDSLLENDGAAFPTSATAFSVGARLRRGLGGTSAVAEVDFGGQSFTIGENMAAAKPPLPSVDYRYVRVGASAHKPLGSRMSAEVGAGYRHVLSAGEIQDETYFPNLQVAGIDAVAAISYRIVSSWSVRAGVDLQRYFYTLNPEPGDPFVAGGAIDQFIGARVALRYRL